MAKNITLRLAFPTRTASPTPEELHQLGARYLVEVGDYEAASGDDDLVILATFGTPPWWTSGHTSALVDDLRALHRPL